jgi:hypothetical protein
LPIEAGEVAGLFLFIKAVSLTILWWFPQQLLAERAEIHDKNGFSDSPRYSEFLREERLSGNEDASPAEHPVPHLTGQLAGVGVLPAGVER